MQWQGNQYPQQGYNAPYQNPPPPTEPQINGPPLNYAQTTQPQYPAQYPPMGGPATPTTPNSYNTQPYSQPNSYQTGASPTNIYSGPPPSPYGTPTQTRSPGNKASTTIRPPLAGVNNVTRPPPSSSTKIDPSQIPTPIMTLDRESKPTFCTVKHVLPPGASTLFSVVDEGSCSPKIMRGTLHAAPSEESILKDSGLPWSLVLSPLSDPSDDNVPVQLVDFGISGPIRCKRCRVYLNPFVQFIDGGRKWRCNFCDVPNEVPAEYYCNLDADGNRRDLQQRPELSKGSIEYDVQNVAEYAFRGNTNAGKKIPQEEFKPAVMPLNYVFLIDISTAAYGVLPSVTQALKYSIVEMAKKYPDAPLSVSFITYGSTVQFYDFSKTNMPMYVVSDINDIFVPLPFSKVCWLNVHNDSEKIDEFFEKLPSFVQNSNEPNSCVGSALKAASLILAESGGRVVCFFTSNPKVGMGTFKAREEYKLYGTDNEKQLYSPVDGYWTQLANDFAKKQIAVDMFLFAFTTYCELVTLGQVSHLTGGNQSFFINFHPQTDYMKLHQSLTRNLTRSCGYAGLIRVRCSRGVRVREYLGHYLSQDPLDMDVAGVDADTSYLVELQHDDKLDVKNNVYLQAAMLYTNREGLRRIRVHTLRVPIVNTLPNLFRHADLDATVAAFSRRTVMRTIKNGTNAAREHLTAVCVDILTSYRKHCASNPSPGQLILPEALKLLPIYCLALMKSNTFRPGTDVRVDERIQEMFELLRLKIEYVLPWVYPRLYPLHSLSPMAGTYDENKGAVILPPTDSLSSERLNGSGVYLLHDFSTQHLLIWIGERVNPKLLQALFNVENVDKLFELNYVETSSSERVVNIIREIRRNRPDVYDTIRVIREKRDPLEALFFQRFVEDKVVNGGVWSYVEYLCHLHRHIQNRLS